MAYITTSSSPMPGPAMNHGSCAGRRSISPLGYYVAQQSQLGDGGGHGCGVPRQAGAAYAGDAEDGAAVQLHDTQATDVQDERPAVIEPAETDEIVQAVAGNAAQCASGE